jgi:hypothetical protein
VCNLLQRLNQWSSGQDQARAIKAQLTALIPGLRVFLDIDDLSDISALEQLIDATDVIIVFLSGSAPPGDAGGERSDYMRSANCMRELRRAVETGKRLVFVSETDAQHGAVSMATHRRDCPAELRHVLDEHPVVPWHRTQPFASVSLRQIAERVVGAWRDGDSLRVPGEELRRPTLVSPPPPARFHLYASPHNPGATEVAALLSKEADGTLTFTTSEPRAAQHMLLYLNSELALAPPPTAVGAAPVDAGDAAAHAPGRSAAQRLHAELVDALRNGMPLLMVHEQRAGEGAAPFGRIMSKTPDEVKQLGLYDTLATPLLDGADHQRASLRVLLSQVDMAKAPPRLVLDRRWMGMWRRRRVVRVKDEGPMHLLEMSQTEPGGRERQKSRV